MGVSICIWKNQDTFEVIQKLAAIWKNPDSFEIIRKIGSHLENPDSFEIIWKIGSHLENPDNFKTHPENWKSSGKIRIVLKVLRLFKKFSVMRAKTFRVAMLP